MRGKEGDNTMEEAHPFRVVAWWASGRTGIANSSSAPNAIHFTSPPAFGGMDGRWTPEDLLLCAVASCYTTTFRAVAESSKFEYKDLQVEVDGAIAKSETGYHFGEVFIRANLTISHEQEQARAIKLLQKAKELCLVSRALSLEQRFEPRVQVVEPRVEVGHSLSVVGKEVGRRSNPKAQ
jgi:peroxiredoxin-like protein